MSNALVVDSSKNSVARLGDLNLKPLKVVIHGPPAAGKTEIAKRISRRYGPLYISVATMIQDTLDDLRQNITNAREQAFLRSQTPKSPQPEGVEDEEELEDDGMDQLLEAEIEQYNDQINDITRLLSESPDQRLPDEYVVKLMRTFLSKEYIQSHGYILDGYPKTLQQAKELFGQLADVPKDSEGTTTAATQEEVAGEGLPVLGGLVGNASVNIMPDYVITLQADDLWLCERLMRLPESQIHGTKFSEDSMVRRLLEFRDLNEPDNTVLNFFDEIDIHPIVVDLQDVETKDVECVLNYLYDIFGPPIPGLGMSVEEDEKLRKLKEKEEQLLRQQQMLERQLAQDKAQVELERKIEEWTEIMEKLQLEEEKIIAAESEPLKYYLMKYVFPTLTKGLSEVAKVKPEDPVDYLAEYLFRENPEGRMFNPSYTRDGEELMSQHEDMLKNATMK